MKEYRLFWFSIHVDNIEQFLALWSKVVMIFSRNKEPTKIEIKPFRLPRRTNDITGMNVMQNHD